ncbi:centrosomal protein of 128 kDa-like isoform X4 [Symsagittifera roscoffensis]|uniref:centrosomal protein of 128 kDa-like isoform X4 n=1 Tax=Symsagittifera roscoffensis TaxID=84072 RepID=UPI00307C8A96
MSVRSGRRRGLPDTDEDTPRSADSGGSSAIDDETEESLIAKRVERLASSLQDTGKNLRNVSGMLEEFKDRDQDRGAAIDHLRVELQQSTELLREERRRSIKERERLKIPGVARGRSMSPRFARRVEMHATHGVMPESHVRPRSNRSVSPGILGSRRSTGQQYRQYTSGIPLHLPGDLGGNGNIWNDMPASDRSGGDETKQLLQELVENQRNLLQVQAQPQLMQHPHGYNNENDRLAQLESMLTKLQNDMKVSKSGSKVSGRQFENPDISEELRKEMMNGHVTPQIRSPRANTGGSQRATKYSSSTSAPEDEREASSEQSERNLKRKLIRSESAIAELEKQLDDAHRRLENSEVGRGEGQRQVVELREQLNRSEQDREQLRTRVNDYTHDIQREVSKREEAFASEKRILEEEIRRLKGQLNDPRRNTEFETMKAEVEKLDKLKSTLGKRVEEVQKKNQEKDMEATEFTYKMREMTNKLEDSDRVKKKAISRVDDLTRELNVLKIEREKIVEQLRNAETQLNQKTKETEEITTKSKTIINALKTKTQKLTNDLDKATNAHQSHVDRINQLEREVEAGRLQATAAAASKDRGLVTGADSGQLAAIHKEIHDVMVMRGEQEDLMRRKNEEIHDLRGELESLQRAHTSLKDDMDKVDEEITLNRKRLMEAESTRDEQEDELIKLRTEGEVTRDELNRASAKAEELAIQVEQLQRRISEEVKEKEENKMALIQTEKKERLAREEISSLLIKLSEQEQMHNRVVGELKRDIQELVDVEQKNVQQMVQGMKAERNQLETEIANLRLEVSNEKESARDMRENLEKLERELIEASDNSKKQAETELALSTKVEALQFEITIKDNLAQELESRIKKLERTLKAAKEKLKKEEHDRLTVMSTVSKGVNGLVDAAAGEGSLGRHKSNTPMASGADANAWLAEIKAKMSWLLTEVTSWYSKEKDVQHQLKRTQQDILTLLNNSNQDKSFFIEQLEKQGSQIKHISTEKEDVRLGNIDQESRLMTLHHNVEDLSNRLQMEAERDEYEFSVKNSRCETMTNGDLYYPNNKYFSSMAASGAPMTVYSAARLDSDRIGTDSTVTPEQSVLHYTQPFTLDFSAVPFHLVAAADGLAVHPSQHQMVYPQSSSTPAPVPMSKVAADRLTHTPPTKHNAGDWHAAMSSAGRSINTGGVPNGIYGTTSSAFQPMMSSVNLNTKAPMSMTDEEFRAQFIPNAPPAEPTMIPMQPEKEFFAGRK